MALSGVGSEQVRLRLRVERSKDIQSRDEKKYIYFPVLFFIIVVT